MVKTQEIANPRRILAVSLEASTAQLSRIVEGLTSTHPQPTSASLAGTTHDLPLRTAYYTATVPIWLDLVNAPSDWANSFLSDEAKEVLEVLGGIVVVFAIPSSSSPSKDETIALINEVGRLVREGLGGWEWDGVRMAVGVGPVEHLDDLDTWDEVCGDAGLEFVHDGATATGGGGTDVRNEFGEKVGIPRLLEALEANDWASGGGLGPLDDDDDENAGLGSDGEFDFENMDFGIDREDFEGLRKAIWEAKMEREDVGGGHDQDQDQDGSAHDRDQGSRSGSGAGAGSDGATKHTAGDVEDGDDDDIRKVEQMMQKLQAVRDLSAGLPEAQRKRMAAKAVGEVMRDL